MNKTTRLNEKLGSEQYLTPGKIIYLRRWVGLDLGETRLIFHNL